MRLHIHNLNAYRGYLQLIYSMSYKHLVHLSNGGTNILGVGGGGNKIRLYCHSQGGHDYIQAKPI